MIFKTPNHKANEVLTLGLRRIPCLPIRAGSHHFFQPFSPGQKWKHKRKTWLHFYILTSKWIINFGSLIDFLNSLDKILVFKVCSNFNIYRVVFLLLVNFHPKINIKNYKIENEVILGSLNCQKSKGKIKFKLSNVYV